MIERNKNGNLGNIAIGLASILDGLAIVFSLGFFRTSFTLAVARYQAKKRFFKKIVPMTVAQDIVGVEPMKAPEGLIFSFRPYHYKDHKDE
jgi:hypothetical protein